MNEKEMKKVVGIIATIIIIICAIPFIRPEVKIEWTTYLSIPFIILGGSVGFMIKRFEGIIWGTFLGLALPILWQSFQSTISAFP
jgi:hypothetical protein